MKFQQLIQRYFGSFTKMILMKHECKIILFFHNFKISMSKQKYVNAVQTDNCSIRKIVYLILNDKCCNKFIVDGFKILMNIPN